MANLYTSTASIDNNASDSIIPETLESSNEEEYKNSSSIESMPQNILNRAEKVAQNLLPVKSKEKYEVAYEKFMEWRKTQRTNSFAEPVLLAYFDELSEKMKPSSLWATYSMLRSTIHARHDINIYDYAPLIQFLIRNSTGYQAK